MELFILYPKMRYNVILLLEVAYALEDQIKGSSPYG